MEGHPHRDIGNRLKNLRGDVSQGEFATLLGIKQQQYSRYETGKNRPPYPVLKKIADHARVSVDWIITGDITAAQYITGDDFAGDLAKRLKTIGDAHLMPASAVSDEELSILRCLRLLPMWDSLYILGEIIKLLTSDTPSDRSRFVTDQISVLKKIVDDRREFAQGIDWDGYLLGYKRLRKRVKELHNQEKKYSEDPKENK